MYTHQQPDGGLEGYSWAGVLAQVVGVQLGFCFHGLLQQTHLDQSHLVVLLVEVMGQRVLDVVDEAESKDQGLQSLEDF